MIVFKCYMKILRQNVTLVIIYLGIFFSVALVMQMAAGKSEDSLYANTSIDIGVVKGRSRRSGSGICGLS